MSKAMKKKSQNGGLLYLFYFVAFLNMKVC